MSCSLSNSWEWGEPCMLGKLDLLLYDLLCPTKPPCLHWAPCFLPCHLSERKLQPMHAQKVVALAPRFLSEGRRGQKARGHADNRAVWLGAAGELSCHHLSNPSLLPSPQPPPLLTRCACPAPPPPRPCLFLVLATKQPAAPPHVQVSYGLGRKAKKQKPSNQMP